MLQAEKIDVNIKTFKNSGVPENLQDKKAIDWCKENDYTLKVLLEGGHLDSKDANDHVTRLLDRGDNLEKEKKYFNAFANYKVSNLLLKQFGTTTEESKKLLLRSFKCFKNTYQAAG